MELSPEISTPMPTRPAANLPTPFPHKKEQLPLTIILLGAPKSGKSLLIQALLRNPTQSQDDPLELQHVSDNAIPRCGELYEYRTVWEHPYHSGHFSPVRLYECDRKSAEELVDKPECLLSHVDHRALTEAIGTADTVVLVIHATAPIGEIEYLFHAFREFLDNLEQSRAYRREVGGLPVFLTLTKCDALAQPADEPTDWLRRIEDRKAEITRLFQDYFAEELADDDPTQIEPIRFLDFGSLDVQVAATAIQLPAGAIFRPLGDANGCFEIARLRHDLFVAASEYRQRKIVAQQRLLWMLGGLTVLILMMMIGAGSFTSWGMSGPVDALARRVIRHQNHEGPPAVRLADSIRKANQKELEAIQQMPLFPRLPAQLQEYVKSRVREYQAYEVYRRQFAPPQLAPQDLRTRAEIEELRQRLETTIVPPPEYRNAWQQTTASQLREKWRIDLELLSSAEDILFTWYRGLERRASDLLFIMEPPGNRWRRDVAALFERAATPPFSPADPIPGSPSLPGIARGEPIRYATAFEFDRILLALRDWHDSQQRLTNLRDLCDLLGLTSGDTPALLQLPEPESAEQSRALANDRLMALEQAFPDADPAHPDWSVSQFPDPVRRWLEPRLRSVYETGIRHGQRILEAELRHHSGRFDHPGLNKALLAALQSPHWQHWQRLLSYMQRWANITEADVDPVTELARFLQDQRFTISVDSLELSLPDDLLDRGGQPSGPLILTWKSRDAQKPREFRFLAEGMPRLERPVTRLRFVAESKPVRMEYHPGDQLSLALPLRAGGQEYRLLWNQPRSEQYQFDVLRQPARLERLGPFPLPPEPAAGVILAPSPEAGWPRVPALFPNLRSPSNRPVE